MRPTIDIAAIGHHWASNVDSPRLLQFYMLNVTPSYQNPFHITSQCIGIPYSASCALLRLVTTTTHSLKSELERVKQCCSAMCPRRL